MRMVRAGFSRALALLAAVGTVAGLLVAVSTAPASAAAAAAQQFYAMHWNIAGAILHDDDASKPNNYGTFAVVDRLADLAATWRPSVISVNEACDSQVDALRDRLEDRGLHVYEVAFSGTPVKGPGPLPDLPHNACLRSGGWYPGAGLLSLVPASDPENLWFDDETNRVVRYRTRRAGACLTLHLIRNVRACSLHLSQNGNAAITQAQQFVNTYRDDIEAYPYMLLGDFNATPNQLLGTMYDSSAGGFGEFYEADMDAPNLGLPTAGDRKIDYAFVSSNAFDRQQLALATIEPGVCRVENAFQLPPFVLYPHPCSTTGPSWPASRCSAAAVAGVAEAASRRCPRRPTRPRPWALARTSPVPRAARSS